MKHANEQKFRSKECEKQYAHNSAKKAQKEEQGA